MQAMPPETDRTVKEQYTAPHLKPYHFQPGQSGNPAGRGKGVLSIRESVRKYLEDNPEELKDMVRKLVKNQAGLTWKMTEGEPPKEVRLGNPDGSALGEPSELVRELTKKLNAIHGGAGVGGDGVGPGPVGQEA